MKKILLLLTALLYVNFVQAQDPRLFENDWYVSVLEIEGTVIEKPATDFVTQIYFFEEPETEFQVFHVTCNYGLSSSNVSYTNSVFTIDEPIYLGSNCSNQNFADFVNLHDSVYYENDVIPINPFSYTIDEIEGYLQLTVTNANGDIAIYNSILLGNESFLQNSMVLYPNPVRDLLQVESAWPVAHIAVYGVQGQKLWEGLPRENGVDLSQFGTGLYFVEVRTEMGSVVKRVVKD